MNMLEPASLNPNPYISNSKSDPLGVRSPVADEHPPTTSAEAVVPVHTDFTHAMRDTSSSEAVAMAPLDDFKTITEISVDPSTSELLVKVPSELVGRMIGKNGLVIKELQSHSGAFINMAKEGDIFRIARISGNYPETHLCALMLVSRFTQREDQAKHEKLDALIASFKKLRPMKPFVMENFNVPAEHVGRIIGRGGHTIRELQEQSHAKIDIPKAFPGVDSHRVLTISGSPEDVAACRELLKARIANIDAREAAHMDALDGPFSFQDMQAQFMQPASFPEGRFIQGMYPAAHPYPYYAPVPYGVESVYYPSQYPFGYVPYAPMPFHPQDLSTDMSRVSLSPSIDSQDGDAHDHQVPFMHSPPQTLHGPTPLHAQAPLFVPSQQCESIVPVPADLVGRLIGRQGVAVKQLQAETKTRVDVLDPMPGSDPGTRFVRVTALRLENVRACESQIKARIAAHFGNAFA